MVVLSSERIRDSVPCSISGCKGKAEVCCFTRRQYFCRVCDLKSLVELGRADTDRVLVRDMKAFVDFSGPAPANCTDSRKHWNSTSGPLYSNFVEDGVVRDTLWTNFQMTARKFPKKPFLGERLPTGNQEFAFISYSDVQQMVECISSGLIAFGISPKQSVGIYLPNSIGWILAELSAYRLGHVTVPLYDTLGQESAAYILEQAQIRVLFTSSDKLELIRQCKSVHLQLVVVVEPRSDPLLLPMLQQTGHKSMDNSSPPEQNVLTISQLHQLGQGSRHPPSPPTPSDLATICYTSGTTGMPKGVMLTHSTIISNVGSMIQNGVFTNEDDVHLSYLPLPHMFERICHGLLVAGGSSIGFYRGDVSLLLDDIQALKPTIFAGVPRLYNRIVGKIQAQLEQSGILTRFLFRQAYASKQAGLAQGSLTHSVWDRLIFSKLKQALGGRVGLLISGAAPISGETMEFLRIAFSAPVVEGYGMSETAAGGTITDALHVNSFGNVGTPIRSIEIRLVDVPEMGYYSTDKPFPRGEICFRGPGVFSGYFGKEEATREALDEQGWLHSGDIGVFLGDQTLKLVDRKKNIFKLAQGEYVAPEKIEGVYGKSLFVGQVFVHGSSLESFLVGVVVPDEEYLKEWAQRTGRGSKSFPELVQDQEVQQVILQDMDKVARAGGLSGFERLARVHFETELFSVENGLMTPTFKLKRAQAAERYELEIKSMYAEPKAITSKL